MLGFERIMEMLSHTNYTIKDSDVDAVILNCGETGSGKSTFDIVMGIYYEEVLNKRPFTLVNTVFAPKQFQTRLSQAERYSFITGDEGIELFFSRNAMTGANKKLAKSMAQTRAGKNYLILVNIPDIRMVEGYIKTGGATAIVRTKTMWCPEANDGKGKYMKGYVDIYNYPDIQNIKMEYGKPVEWGQPSFTDTFPDVRTFRPELGKEYFKLSTGNKALNRQTDLDNWDKKPVEPKEIKKELEIDHFIWQSRKGRKKIPYMKLASLVKRKFNRTITDAGCKYKFDHYVQ